MTQGKVGSYDDAVESEVSTVLQVPLLWRQNGLVAVEPRSARHRAPSGPRRNGGRGRHRAPEAVEPEAVEPEATQAPPSQPQAAQPARARAAVAGREEYAHTLRVGLISAALVLLGFIGVLFALAVWLP